MDVTSDTFYLMAVRCLGTNYHMFLPFLLQAQGQVSCPHPVKVGMATRHALVNDILAESVSLLTRDLQSQ